MGTTAQKIPPSITQSNRQKRFGAAGCVDIHCHCLPGLDDGPESLSDAVALCRSLVDDGITTVIATPHQLGRYEGRNSAAQIRVAVDELTLALAEEKIPLVVKPGGDVRIDERLIDGLAEDKVMTLADTGKYILLELPHDLNINPRQLLGALISDGRIPILSHPERNTILNRRADSLIPWIENGALLQVTAGSLTGSFGDTANKMAWQWLGRGWIHLVATDAHHAIKRKPLMSAAIELVASRLTHSITRRVFIENPLLVFAGQPIRGWNFSETARSQGVLQ